MGSEEKTGIVAFARARLTQDERVADTLAFACRLPDKTPDFTACGGPAAEAYWGHFTEARAVRAVDALRELITFAVENAAQIDGEWGDGHEAAEIVSGKCEDHGMKALMRALGPIAAIWSDHPDYRQEWKLGHPGKHPGHV